jgi:hypothetical protein
MVKLKRLNLPKSKITLLRFKGRQLYILVKGEIICYKLKGVAMIKITLMNDDNTRQ